MGGPYEPPCRPMIHDHDRMINIRPIAENFRKKRATAISNSGSFGDSNRGQTDRYIKYQIF